MTSNRWEWLEGLRPESPVEVAVKYMAKLVADELADWPPEVRAPEGQGPSRFAEVLGPGAARPQMVVFKEAIKRARWELERDFDAIDFYERNHHLARQCPEPKDQLAAEFSRHYILEAFYTLIERTESRVKRKDVLVGVDLVEQRLELLIGTN